MNDFIDSLASGFGKVANKAVNIYNAIGAGDSASETDAKDELARVQAEQDYSLNREQATGQYIPAMATSNNSMMTFAMFGGVLLLSAVVLKIAK